MFDSLTYDKVTEQEMNNIIKERCSVMEEYEIHVGTDSQSYSGTNVVVVVLILEMGDISNKARFFFSKTTRVKRFENLRVKIESEVNESIMLGLRLKEFCRQNDIPEERVEIDLDVGRNGPTKDLIQAMVGWVVGSGFKCNIKPDSPAASSIADKKSKKGSGRAPVPHIRPPRKHKSKLAIN